MRQCIQVKGVDLSMNEIEMFTDESEITLAGEKVMASFDEHPLSPASKVQLATLLAICFAKLAQEAS